MSHSAEAPRELARGQGTTVPDHGHLPSLARLPLPGVVIFVHGVNSDGEWYEATEQGLCAGLNTRLARRSEQLVHDGPEAGQLTPALYTPELTSAGFIEPDRCDKNFIQPKAFWSPVIRFRWGYKACKEEVQDYGANVWLNEHDYWGGGPFANGCSSVADLWSEGLNDRLFLWITAQHLNPVPGRDVYRCPPRAYYVHAALRLAKLIKSIRDLQADCPITVVCHSQGNMIGIGAAFLAERLGVQADNYVLCNAPLSLLEHNGTESWTQRGSRDGAGHSGRVTGDARTRTLAAYFDMLRERANAQQPADLIDRQMANTAPRTGRPFSAGADRAAHGLNGSTYGRVTLYCNPHDQVISATTVQGIGWLGLSASQILLTRGAGVFSQRVFAQGYEVGQSPGAYYDYWEDRWNREVGKEFWHPPSPSAHFSLRLGLESNTTVVGRILTLATAPLLMLLVDPFRVRVNAEPDKGWKIPIDAPQLPETFKPRARRYGTDSEDFDEGFDPAGNARSRTGRESGPHDPYASHPTQQAADGTPDVPLGDTESEAHLRYEDRARLRMKARRAGMADAEGKVPGEGSPDGGDEAYRRWRNQQIGAFLSEGADQNATDHSTIVTQPMHAEKALAWDVAVGVCTLSEAHWHDLRVEADWRYSKGLTPEHRHRNLCEYFLTGTMGGEVLNEWVKTAEANRPGKIIDDRQSVVREVLAMGEKR
jgi:hypothetical protein